MLSEEELKDSKLLVFANKQDLPGALNEGEVSEKLGLSELKDRQWSIHKCCATKGEGLEEGLDWYVHQRRLSCWPEFGLGAVILTRYLPLG